MRLYLDNLSRNFVSKVIGLWHFDLSNAPLIPSPIRLRSKPRYTFFSYSLNGQKSNVNPTFKVKPVLFLY